MLKKIVFLLFTIILCLFAYTQKHKNLIYVDSKGVIRYTKDKSEAAFFGVNYTVPFAYGFRSHKALGVDVEKAIDTDVYHMARLNLDAFRVHVWDVEISDSAGNLLENEHLRLFDYLIKKLKEKRVKILITPIAFWGNGYPEPDTKTNGFSYVYTKRGAVVREEAFKAQENYLKQFLNHINPYTKLSYKDDPDVIAMEINNEPQHSGPKDRVTEYVTRMTAAVKSTGWTKPVFYNISESPAYADAVVKANVDGHSFQWYPTGLVANYERKGNFLPNVDRYHIPFTDTIAAFKNRAKMVYEFDAGDVMQPVMYPAMARSYRTAGFQWATQFAYDPLYTAYANTEYQTHYLNLAYTPSKAISLLIASKVFHRLPRLKSYGIYPADTLFDVFRVGYKEQLSEMNTEEEFYYSNSTSTIPKAVSRLKHIAGVGNSPVVQYEGTGAYFLDRISNNVWRLEVMPDAIAVNDPFERASPKKEVTRIQWRRNKMQLAILKCGDEFFIRGLDSGNTFKASVKDDAFFISPGIYEIKSCGEFVDAFYSKQLFYAPKPSVNEPIVVHSSFPEVSSNKPLVITATVAGVDSSDKISVEIRNSHNKWKTVPLQHLSGYLYYAHVPVDMMLPGLINYRIMVWKKNGETYTFPGSFEGDPYAWDEYRNQSWQTFVALEGSEIELFNAIRDREKVMIYNPDWRNNTVEYVAGKNVDLLWQVSMNYAKVYDVTGFQFYFKDKIAGRSTEINSVSKLVITASCSSAGTIRVALIDKYGQAFAAHIDVDTTLKEIELPLKLLQKNASLLLPRPYPDFQPLWFTSAATTPFGLDKIEKLEVLFMPKSSQTNTAFQLRDVRLSK
jgi:hypothetical protein